MDMNVLKDAMKRRRGKGVKLEIIIGGPDEQEQMAHSGLGNDEDPEEQLMDLAPEVKDRPDQMAEEEQEEEGMPGEVAEVKREERGTEPDLLSENDHMLPMHKKMMAMKMKK